MRWRTSFLYMVVWCWLAAILLALFQPLSLLGAIAQHYVATATPAGRVGSPAVSGTATVTYPQTPTAGNLLVMCLIQFHSGNDGSVPTAPTSISAWTLVGSETVASSTAPGTRYVQSWYQKTATGSEGTSFSLTGMTNTTDWATIVWEYARANLTPTLSTGVSANGATGQKGTLTNSISAAASDVLLSVLMVIHDVAWTVTWGGGTTADVAVTNITTGNDRVGLASGVQSVDTAGTISPSAAYKTAANGNIYSSSGFAMTGLMTLKISPA